MEDGAVEAVEVAAIITKEVFNPLAKLTKGFQNAVMAKGQNQQKAEQVNPFKISPAESFKFSNIFVWVWSLILIFTFVKLIHVNLSFQVNFDDVSRQEISIPV